MTALPDFDQATQISLLKHARRLTTDPTATAPPQPGTPQTFRTMREAVKTACKPQAHRTSQAPSTKHQAHESAATHSPRQRYRPTTSGLLGALSWCSRSAAVT